MSNAPKQLVREFLVHACVQGLLVSIPGLVSTVPHAVHGRRGPAVALVRGRFRLNLAGVLHDAVVDLSDAS